MDEYRYITVYVNKYDSIDLIGHSEIDLQRHRVPYL